MRLKQKLFRGNISACWVMEMRLIVRAPPSEHGNITAALTLDVHRQVALSINALTNHGRCATDVGKARGAKLASEMLNPVEERRDSNLLNI